jgi:hypothetical protein
MSRVINTNSPTKVRNQARRTIAEILRLLSTKPSSTTNPRTWLRYDRLLATRNRRKRANRPSMPGKSAATGSRRNASSATGSGHVKTPRTLRTSSATMPGTSSPSSSPASSPASATSRSRKSPVPPLIGAVLARASSRSRRLRSPGKVPLPYRCALLAAALLPGSARARRLHCPPPGAGPADPRPPGRDRTPSSPSAPEQATLPPAGGATPQAPVATATAAPQATPTAPATATPQPTPAPGLARSSPAPFPAPQLAANIAIASISPLATERTAASTPRSTSLPATSTTRANGRSWASAAPPAPPSPPRKSPLCLSSCPPAAGWPTRRRVGRAPTRALVLE